MSTHYANGQEKCWSCEYFSGERKRSNGGPTHTSTNGTCSCKRSLHFNKSISESGLCSKYQKWSVIAFEIAKKENDELLRKQREENRRSESEMREEQRQFERERMKLERERLALEQERKRLEYERWYASLSPEEKAKEDVRIQEERRRAEIEAEERRIRSEQEKKELEAQRLIDEENAKKRKKRNLIIILSLIGAVILLVIGINVSKSIKKKQQQEAFNNSSTGMLTSYLIKKPTYKNGAYSEYADIEGRGRIIMTIEYKKSGFVDDDEVFDYRVTTTLLPKEGEQYTVIYGYFFFNLDGSDNNDSFGTWSDSLGRVNKSSPNYCAMAKYGDGSVLIRYQDVEYYSSIGQPKYKGSYYNYTNWDKAYSDCMNEWTESGWQACLSSFIFANELAKEATGNGLYK